MKTSLSFLALAQVLLTAPVLGAPPPATSSVEQLAKDYLALREAQPYARPLNMREALELQKAFVKKLEPSLGKPVGYKVGLVTREAQERFHVDSPIYGVLLGKMMLKDGDELPAHFGVHPIFEADLIVVVKDKGINQSASVLDVAEHLKDVVAFIELPDAFVATNTLDGAMLAAANVGARFGVLGQRLPMQATPEFVKALASMNVTILDSTGAELGKAQGKVILDQPLNAVLWLIEELKKSGEKLKPGDLISLGSIRAIPVPAGKAVTVRYDGLPGGSIQVNARFR